MHVGRRLILALLIGVAAAGCDGNDEESGLKVMTWNAYYGFDVGPVLGAQSAPEMLAAVVAAFAQLQATRFEERAAAFADRVAVGRPHLVGLQEVALIRLQTPGDAAFGGQVLGEEVFQDSLQVLLKALADRGLDYRVAGKVQNVDVELPLPTAEDLSAFTDIRLTDFDVVLARGDVAVSNVAAANYAARLPVASLGLEVPRGYVAVDAAWGRHAVRFVTTHLEDLPFEPIQRAQAAELAGALAAEAKPVVLVGDFNSPAPGGATCGDLAEQGFLDAWARNLRRDEGEGLTWGHDADLKEPQSAFTMRIDLILVRPGPSARLGLVAAEVWGDDPWERTASGLWPSDHGAVAAWLQLKPRSR